MLKVIKVDFSKKTKKKSSLRSPKKVGPRKKPEFPMNADIKKLWIKELRKNEGFQSVDLNIGSCFSAFGALCNLYLDAGNMGTWCEDRISPHVNCFMCKSRLDPEKSQEYVVYLPYIVAEWAGINTLHMDLILGVILTHKDEHYSRVISYINNHL